MPLSAIIFDMDGTLGNTLPFITQALQETFHRFTGRGYSDDEITAMFGPTDEGVILPRVPGPQGEEALRYYFGRYSDLHHTAREPFPGVTGLLQMLKARGVKVGIVTGKGEKAARISMEAFGLEPYVDELVAGSYNGAEKPQAIRRLLERWHIPPAQAAYVGDTAYDMRSAREVGVVPLGAAWARTTNVASDEPHRFTDVGALKAWLEENV